jgi:hypothetical protein
VADEESVETVEPVYRDRVFALVDVLGWKEMIERSVKNPEAVSAVRHVARAIAFTESALGRFRSSLNKSNGPDSIAS